MRRMTYFVMALALVLGLAQCKKEQPQPQSEGVRITLNVENGGKANDGSKAEVNPPHVSFVNGDQILVASGGHYVGTLTHDGSSFGGSITDPVENEPLYFYFLGNKIDVTTLTPGTSGSTSCTVNISDQTSELPVISMAPSEETYPSDGNVYTATLQNKCSLIKFKVTTPSNSPICITGMNNQVTVNFNDRSENDGFSYGKADTEGVIKMKGGSGTNVEKWAIVLQQDAYTTPGAEGTAYTLDGNYLGARPAIPEITMNQCFADDRTMEVNTVNPDGLLATPLTLEALTDGDIQVLMISLDGPGTLSTGMKYSVNGSEKTTITSTTTIDVTEGDKVQFYGNGTATQVYGGITTSVSFLGSAEVKAYGNIMSLINETRYDTCTALPNDSCVFFGLFSGGFFINNEQLTDASGLQLPATKLAKSCYKNMFYYCTSLKSAPALPATELAEGCYYSMFEGCTSLTTAPTQLPATKLTEYCYNNMFCGCGSLTAAPELPATELADYCYYSMFEGCESLTTAPVLPATILVDFCYFNLFFYCSHLSSVTCLATDISAPGCTINWLVNVAAKGTITTPSSTPWHVNTFEDPSGWTRVDAQ